MKPDIKKLLDETRFVNDGRHAKSSAELGCPGAIHQEPFVAQPLLSILVLVYNHSATIRECLNSIFEQRTTFPYEVIIADDRSTDDSLAICKEYLNSYPDRVCVLSAKSNAGGPFENTVRSLPFIRGKYMCVCEGDDAWCDSHKLQRQVDFLEAHPDYSMPHSCLYTQYENHPVTRCPLSRRTRGRLARMDNLAKEDFARSMLMVTTVSTQTALYRSKPFTSRLELLDRLAKEVGWVPVADFITFFLVACDGKCHYDDHATAFRRMNAGSLTAITDKSKAYARMVGDTRAALWLANEFNVLTSEQLDAKVIECLKRVLSFIALTGKKQHAQDLHDFFLQYQDKMPPVYQQAIAGDYAPLKQSIVQQKHSLVSDRSFWGALLRKVIIVLDPRC